MIDELYAEALNGNDNLITRLETNKILPDWWNSKKKTEKLVRESVDQLRNKLNERNNFPVTLESIAQGQYEEKLALEQKENKTESDLQRLQALEYLENNHDERDRLNQRTLNTLKADAKYWDIQQLVKWSLYSMFVELGWWAIWENGDIYNDIVWYGFWNASDKNAKMIWEIAKEIAITVAVCVATWWMWSAAIAWLLRWAASGARALKRANLANKISKIAKVAKYSGKFSKLSTVWKITRIGTRVPSLLLEWTVFNATSNVVHSAMNWTSLDNINLNPVAKENIQTAAFLGALSIGNQIAWVLMQVWWKTKLCVNLMKGLEKAHLKNPAVFTTQVTAELTTMLAAEQAINLVYWHDVINPDTGEIDHVRTRTPPTKEELIQTVWMILAFKMVKPWIWHNVEQKLNNWTLEICRSTKKWEFLIRDTKSWETSSLQDMIDWKDNWPGWTKDFRDFSELSEQEQKLREKFDEQIMSKDWVTIDWITYKLEWQPNMTQNQGRKWRIIYTETGPDWKVRKTEVASDTFVLPDNSWWNWIRNRFNAAREKYIREWSKNQPSTSGLESPTEEVSSWRSAEELNNLQRRNNERQSELEQRQRELTERRAKLEADRKANRESLGEQPNISIENISEILQKWNIITIDWIKYKYNWIKNWEAEFVIDKNAKKWIDEYNKHHSNQKAYEEVIKIKELSE